MRTYIETLVIFILCFCLFPFQDLKASTLVFLMLAISLSCFSISFQKKIPQIIIGSFAIGIAFFNPLFVVFLPAILYAVFFRKHYVICGIGMIPALIYHHTISTHNAMIYLTYGISFYLAYRNQIQKHLETTIKALRDNSVEQEMQLRHKNEQLIISQNENIYVATLSERNRIAREIHDNVGHMLSRSILQVGALLAICKDAALKPHLESLKDTLNEAMNNIRNSVHDLHDESVDLKSALQNLIDNFTFCSISFECDTSRHVPKDVKYCIIAIVKEALNNIIKHSNATEVTVTMREHPGFYQLLVEDNGTNGLHKNDSDGIGLTNMKERASALHGNLHITTDHGFRIFLSIPKQQ
ncbi:MAG: sensor histidine kinase [Eubacteriales bacterium]|nr:sensor histidine kinase [Eubacteriales bacterium]